MADAEITPEETSYPYTGGFETPELDAALEARNINPEQVTTFKTHDNAPGRYVAEWGNQVIGDDPAAIAQLLPDASSQELPTLGGGDVTAPGDRDEIRELSDLDFRIGQGADPSDTSLLEIWRQLSADDNVTSIGTVGGTELINFSDRTDLSLVFEDGSGDASTKFWRTLRDVDETTLGDVTVADIGQDAALVEADRERDARFETREAARDAAAAAGVDLDEFGIDARADGTVVIQDKDANTTRTIDPDAPGGVGSAIDAATGDGQFVADDADPAASGSASGDGLGARAAGAIVLLFGALAAALGWLS